MWYLELIVLIALFVWCCLPDENDKDEIKEKEIQKPFKEE